MKSNNERDSIKSEYSDYSDSDSDSDSDYSDSESDDSESDSDDDSESDSDSDDSESDSDDDDSDSDDSDSDDSESDSDSESDDKIICNETSDDSVIESKYQVGDRVIKLNGIGKGVKGDVIYSKLKRVRVIKDDGKMFNIQSSDNFELFEEKDKDETVLGECAICMNDIKCCDTYSTNCLHIFHKKCMYPWLYGKKNCINKNDCPMCRQDIIV